MIIAETPRLVLRRLERRDLEPLGRVLGDPEVMRFSVFGPEGPEGIAGFLEANLRRYERDGVGQWAVVPKEIGTCVGLCGICAQMVDGAKEFELGYRLARPFWGKGIATEAAIACRDLALHQLHLRRLISIVEADNRASIRVAEKVGMRPEKETTFFGVPVRVYSLEGPSR